MKTFIIAEAGVNHNGSLELALQLVDKAIEAGADCIKFQTFKTENLVNKSAPKASYQIQNTKQNTSQFEMLKSLELSYQQFQHIKEYCDTKSIQFLSTPFDLESADFLNELNIPLFKIPSGEITNLPYLRKINSFEKPIILSTGMATIAEIQDALSVLNSCPVSLLHCTTQYPCPYDSVNLKAINTLQETFHLPVGYSDHTQGIEVSIAAVSIGASILEKHFTLDKTFSGPDHKASLDPIELKTLVDSVRHIEQAFGNGIKEPQTTERANLAIARKSIVARCAIRCGEQFTEQNLTVKRPGNGISPMKWNEIIGTYAHKDYQPDDLIEFPSTSP